MLIFRGVLEFRVYINWLLYHFGDGETTQLYWEPSVQDLSNQDDSMERSLPRVRFCVGRTLFSQTLTSMRQTWVVCSNGKNPTTRHRWLLRGGVVGWVLSCFFMVVVRVRLKVNMWVISGK